MPTSNPADILLSHDRWATQNILDACAKLTPEQFHHRFEMGFGSLHDTVTHVLAAMRGWGDLIAGRENRPRLEGATRTIAELQALLDEIMADFAATAKTHPFEETVTRERDGKTYIFTRGAVLTHVTTHGMHHRAQCLNMLRQLGLDQPPSSVMQWAMTADPMR